MQTNTTDFNTSFSDAIDNAVANTNHAITESCEETTSSKDSGGQKEEEKNPGHYPGADVNRADEDKNTPFLHRQEVRILNNNPRSNDI